MAEPEARVSYGFHGFRLDPVFDYWNKYGPPDKCELRDGKLICK